MIKVLFTIIVFGFLAWLVDFGELANTLINIRLDYLVLLFLIGILMVWLSALKWQVFVRAAGHDAGILHLMKLYTVGYFFNTFTPSYIGGDIARSYHLGRFLNNQKDAFAATFLERFTGLLAMSILGVSFVCLGAKVTAGVEYAIFIVAIGAVALALIFFSRKFCQLFESIATTLMVRFLPEKYSKKGKSIMTKVLSAMESARGNMPLFLSLIHI